MAIAMDVPREEAGPGLMSDLFVLTKARLNLMVIITTFVGFCAASGSSLNWLLLINSVIGTTLAAGGAAVLNQVIESSVDRSTAAFLSSLSLIARCAASRCVMSAKATTAPRCLPS